MTATWQTHKNKGVALKAPFPWFGGKRRVAPIVWSALGDVDHYVEPFAGSLAVLLARPAEHTGTLETVNDADRYLANFWRAVAAAPEEVARYADWPVNECDLFARHSWLVATGRERIARLESDPEWYDAKVAGWWVWGLSAWIGRGWCRAHPKGPHHKLPQIGHNLGVHRKRLGNSDPEANNLPAYFQALADRLRKVRVCCGDWSRVVTRGALTHGSSVGIFLDPPYAGNLRRKNLYTKDDGAISVAVREWAVANGDNPPTWRAYRYSATRAYGRHHLVGSGRGNDANRHNECLWFSPHCVRSEKRRWLFQGIEMSERNRVDQGSEYDDK